MIYAMAYGRNSIVTEIVKRYKDAMTGQKMLIVKIENGAEIAVKACDVVPGLTRCRWFAGCKNNATTIADAGPLGKIPSCTRCNHSARALMRTYEEQNNG